MTVAELASVLNVLQQDLPMKLIVGTYDEQGFPYEEKVSCTEIRLSLIDGENQVGLFGETE